MLVALISAMLIGGVLGLLGLCAALRAGQTARLLEDNPDLAPPLPSSELRRAA